MFNIFVYLLFLVHLNRLCMYHDMFLEFLLSTSTIAHFTAEEQRLQKKILLLSRRNMISRKQQQVIYQGLDMNGYEHKLMTSPDNLYCHRLCILHMA